MNLDEQIFISGHSSKKEKVYLVDFAHEVNAKNATSIKEKNQREKAGQENSEDAVSFSKKIVEILGQKVKAHNSEQDRKANLSMLKKVFKRAANSFSPENSLDKSIAIFSMARVNLFLRMLSNEHLKNAASMDESLANAKFLDISDYWQVEQQDFAKASIDLAGVGDFNFLGSEDLYLEEQDSKEKWYEL
jgi:hypothetical protein